MMAAPTKLEVAKFSRMIEELVAAHGIPFMEAILMHCESSGLEPETAAKLLTPVVKKRIQVEAEDLNWIKKSKTQRLG
jgi:hypothetical protein